MDENNLIKTGIKGLDSILLGGISRSNVILLQGATGILAPTGIAAGGYLLS